MTWPFQPTANFPAQASNNVFNGVLSPSWITGSQRGPHWCVDDTTTLTTAATRLYYYLIYFDQVVTLAGARTFNQSAGDTGETYRVGLYFDNAAAGGPGTLAKDFGETTLTAASALRTLPSSYTVGAPGWYWVAIHHSAATAMYAYTSILQVSAAGYVLPNVARLIGTLATSNEWGSVSQSPFHFVDTAYGALASTAVAPTSSLATAPAVRFYK